MKEHLRKKRSDLDSNFSSLKAFFKIPYTTPIGRKAITAAKFLIATTLLLAILFLSQGIIAQDEFSTEQAPNESNNKFGIMTDISTCTNITSPGIYNLTASISGSSSKHCISINTSDVVLDGQGFQIDGTSSSGSFGIYVMNLTSAMTNITLRNVNIRDWVNGIYFNNTFNITIINSSLRSNTQGIKIVDSISINITGNNDNIESDTTGALEILNLSYCNINNNSFTGAPRGIVATNLQSCNITNNNINTHAQIGISTTTGNNLIFSNNVGLNMNYFFFYNVSNSIIDRNNFTDNSGISAVGIITHLSNYNNITNNNLSRNNNYGLELIQSNYTFVSNNTMNAGPSSQSKGIFLNSSGHNIIENNIANSNYYGFSMNYSHYNNITNNTFNNNNIYGISMISDENNVFVNNTFNNNSQGIYSIYGRNNQFTNNIIDFNNRSGIFLVSSDSNNFTNNTARNNAVWDVNLTGTNNMFTNLTIGPVISFMASNISIKNSSSPAADPTGGINISKWINITNSSANSWLFLNISYTNTEIGSLNESLFIIGRYKSGAWGTTPSAFASPSGVVAGSNYVFANITSFSTFAPLEFTAVAGDSTAPVSLLSSPANNTIRSSGLIEFNCSATDETALSNITFFSNINGSWSSNITSTVSGLSNQSNFTVNGIADGTYIWNCLAKDTSNNQAFNTTNYTITVDTTIPSYVTLNAPADRSNSSSANALFNISANDNLDTNLTCNITLDGNSNNKTLGVQSGGSNSSSVNITGIPDGNHFWNATCYDNANNSNSSATRQFLVDTVRPVLNISFNTTTITINAGSIEIYWNATDTNLNNYYANVSYPNGTVLNQYTNKSATIILTPSSLITNGTYNVSVYSSDGAGNSNLTSMIFNVINNPTPTVILISPANGTAFGIKNVSFVCNATEDLSLANISLYTNVNGSWSINSTQTVSGTVNQSNFTVTGITDGAYIWNCLAKDIENNQSFNSTNYTVTIDTTIPTGLNLLSPAEAYSSTDTSVNFSFSAIDNLDTNITCNLTLDGVVTDSIGVSNGTSASITKIVSAGTHSWNITCYDNALNSNTSITRNFTITEEAAATPSPSGGGGGTTGGGSPPTAPEPPAEPAAALPPAAPPLGQIPPTIPPLASILLPDDPAISPIMGAVIQDLIPIEVELGSQKIENGVEVQFGGRAKLKIVFPNGKPRTIIYVEEKEIGLTIPKLPINIYAIIYPLLLVLVILLATYTGVDYLYERFVPRQTGLQMIAIKAISLVVKIAGDKPTRKTLDKCMNIFTKFISKQLKINKPTYNSALKAMPNDKLKNDFLKLYTEYKAKEGKDITKKELENITKQMIKLINRLG